MTKNVRCTENKKNGKNIKKENLLLRFSLCMFFFCLFVIIGFKFIINSLSINSDEKLHFQEKGNVKYSVCLKDNDFFEDECLDSNMSYVASLIKNISFDFNYQFNGNFDNLVSSVDYEVVAKLIIENNDTKTKYYEKEYVLAPKTSDSIKNNGTLYNLDKKINIDYEYYNNIATNFKSQYGVDSQSYLEVYLNTYNNVNSKYKDIPTSAQISVRIPLSQKAIEIKFNTQEVNKSIDKYITSKNIVINGYLIFIVGITFLFTSLIFLFFIFMIIKKYAKTISKYDKFINKILKEYDRLIVETTTFPDEKEYNVLIINSFNELVDVRDNLRSPIMFYNIKDHKMSKFYILNNNNLYLYIVNSKDIDGGDKKHETKKN